LVLVSDDDHRGVLGAAEVEVPCKPLGVRLNRHDFAVELVAATPFCDELDLTTRNAGCLRKRSRASGPSLNPRKSPTWTSMN
jgi:hypothetical protein